MDIFHMLVVFCSCLSKWYTYILLLLRPWFFCYELKWYFVTYISTTPEFYTVICRIVKASLNFLSVWLYTVNVFELYLLHLVVWVERQLSISEFHSLMYRTVTLSIRIWNIFNPEHSFWLSLRNFLLGRFYNLLM